MGASAPSEADSATIVLDVRGELDMAGALELCREIDAAATEGRRIVIDLSDVTACDSSGVRALMGAAREATIRMRVLILTVTANSAVDRLMTLSGAREFLRLDETREATVSGASRRRVVSIGS